jgi:Tfp pilus assembly protein PilO
MDITGAIQKLSGREKAIVALTVVFVLAFIPYTFMFSPAQQNIIIKRQELSNLNTEISALSLSLTTKVGKEKAVDMPVITLPQANDLAGMLDAISKDAERTGVEFISVTQEGFSQKGKYVEMRLKLELRSRYRPLYDFIRHLGDKHRLFMIQSLRYETNEALYPAGVAILRVVAYLEKK